MNDDEEHKGFAERFSFSRIVPSNVLSSAVFNGAFPYMFFQVISAHMAPVNALLTIMLFPLAGLIWTYYKRRQIDILALGALIVLAIEVVVAVLKPIFDYAPFIESLSWSGPVFVLALLFLVTQPLSRPMALYLDRFFTTGSEAQAIKAYEQHWIDNKGYQGMVRTLNLVWSSGQLLLAVALTLFLFWQPTFLYTAAPLLILCVGYITLIVWSVQHRSGSGEWQETQAYQEQERRW